MAQKILVTGASGYIGSRLIPYLLKEGYDIRAAARTINRVSDRIWAKHPRVELIAMDAFNEESIFQTAKGCQAAYYFIHSMNPSNKNFIEADRKVAWNMVRAAERAGLKRIIYLGGLGDRKSELSKHLQSRAEVSDILHSGKVPVTTLRAAMIMGTGSVSFEILCYLVKRLPVMITPLWVRTECQPIAIRNVIQYLVGCLNKDKTAGQVFDIGGPNIINYHRMMKIYAEEAGLMRRLVIPVPFLTPRLSSYWIHWVAPISASLAVPLAEGLKNKVVCQDSRIREIIFQELLECRRAIRLALNKESLGGITLEGPISCPPVEIDQPGDPSWAGGAHRKLLEKKIT